MATKWQDTSTRLDGYLADAQHFETRAVDKYKELLRAVLAELDAPSEVLQQVTIPKNAERGEREAPLGTVLSESGLHFCFRLVFPSGHYFQWMQLLFPDAAHIKVKLPDDEAIDVTDENGVKKWAAWIAADLDNRVSNTTSGKLSRQMRQGLTPA